MRLLYCGSGWLEVVEQIRRRLPDGMSIEVWDRKTPLIESVSSVNVLLPSNSDMNAGVIGAARELRLVQQPAAGTDNIDVAAAHARGIPVCNAPGQNHVAVAESAAMLMLCVARRWQGTRKSFASGTIGEPLGTELRGRTLGIVGMGRSGTALAEIARGLGMEVVSVGSASSEADWTAFLQAASVVSLHCPLSARTERLFDRARFARCRSGTIFINCARAGIVDQDALAWALDEGPLLGAGIDHHWHEPWDPDEPLYQRDDVVVTPHIGGSTVEAFARIADVVVNNVFALERGEPLRFEVPGRAGTR